MIVPSNSNSIIAWLAPIAFKVAISWSFSLSLFDLVLVLTVFSNF